MAYPEDLVTIRDNISAKLVEISANPQPSYSVEGQSVSWNDYFRMLTEQLKNMNQAINQANPFIISTRQVL